MSDIGGVRVENSAVFRFRFPEKSKILRGERDGRSLETVDCMVSTRRKSKRKMFARPFGLYRAWKTLSRVASQ